MLVDMYVGAQLVSDTDESACDALMYVSLRAYRGSPYWQHAVAFDSNRLTRSTVPCVGGRGRVLR